MYVQICEKNALHVSSWLCFKHSKYSLCNAESGSWLGLGSGFG